MGKEAEGFDVYIPPQLPDETDVHYAWFLEFCAYPEEGEKRSYKALAERLGLNAFTVQQVGAQDKWHDRALKYDTERRKRKMVVREVGLQDFQEAVQDNLGRSLSELYKIVNDKLNNVRHQMEVEPEKVDALDIQRLVNAVDNLDMLGRRAAKLPTVYKLEEVVEDYSGEVYVIGEEES